MIIPFNKRPVRIGQGFNGGSHRKWDEDKEDFMKQGQLVTKLKDIVLGMKDIGNTDESGLQDLVYASRDLLEEQEIIYEKKLLEKFFEALGKGNKAVYKKADIMQYRKSKGHLLDA